MQTSLKDIFTHGFGITPDPDGIDPDIRMAAFNILYIAFLDKYDQFFSTRRLKTVVMTADSVLGSATNLLGSDETGNFDDFGEFWDVKRADTKEVLDEVFDTTEDINGNTPYGYYLTVDRAFFPGVPDGTELACRYRPVQKLIGLDEEDSTTVFMPRKALLSFSRGLAALYGVIEEEDTTAATERVPLIMSQYFGDLPGLLDEKAPKQYSSMS